MQIKVIWQFFPNTKKILSLSLTFFGFPWLSKLPWHFQVFPDFSNIPWFFPVVPVFPDCGNSDIAVRNACLIIIHTFAILKDKVLKFTQLSAISVNLTSLEICRRSRQVSEVTYKKFNGVGIRDVKGLGKLLWNSHGLLRAARQLTIFGHMLDWWWNDLDCCWKSQKGKKVSLPELKKIFKS